MAEWTFLFFRLIHFLMEKSFPFFGKTFPKHLGKYPPSCGSLCVYVETKQGCAADWGTAFDLMGIPCQLVCPVWEGIVYRRKMKKDGTVADSIS